jgi:hypothetical protein
MIMLSELEAGTFSLRDCLGITRPPIFKEFMTFLEAMEVFGCGYQQDVDNKLYSKRQHKTHKDDMLAQLRQLLTLYELLIYYMDQ